MMLSSRTELTTFQAYLFCLLYFRLARTIATMPAAAATKQPNTAIVAAAAGLRAVGAGLRASSLVELSLDEVATFIVGTKEKLSNEVGALVMPTVEAEVVSAFVCSASCAAT